MTKKTWLLSVGLILVLWMAASDLAISGTPGIVMGKKINTSVAPGTRIGDRSLRGGTYQVRCTHRDSDDHEMVLWRMVKSYPYASYASRGTNDITRVQCRWRVLPEKVKNTAVYSSEREGHRVITKILIRGENVEHVFE